MKKRVTLLMMIWLIASYSSITIAAQVAKTEADSLKFIKAYNYNYEGKYDEAFKLYKELYKSNSGWHRDYIANNLGLMYLFGNGTDIDICQAYDLLLESAELGNTNAMNVLGSFWWRDNMDDEEWQALRRKLGKPVLSDLCDISLEWLRKSAKAKDPIGLYRLACFYEGSGFHHENYISDEQKLKLYRESAELGYNYAQMVSGMYDLEEGNVKSAYSLFKKAAEDNKKMMYQGSCISDLVSLCDYLMKNPGYEPVPIVLNTDRMNYHYSFTHNYGFESFVACLKKDGWYQILEFDSAGNLLTEYAPLYKDFYKYDNSYPFEMELLESKIFHVSMIEAVEAECKVANEIVATSQYKTPDPGCYVDLDGNVQDMDIHKSYE